MCVCGSGFEAAAGDVESIPLGGMARNFRICQSCIAEFVLSLGVRALLGRAGVGVASGVERLSFWDLMKSGMISHDIERLFYFVDHVLRLAVGI